MNYCLPCSDSCEGCSERADYCTTCNEYYKLLDDGTCVFKYGRLIVFGVLIVIFFLLIMIFFVVKCVCFEKPPAKPDFGTILDKDPDLLSDHRKVDMKTIGVNSKYARQDDSIISVVRPNDDSYMDVSRVSQDPVISHLLASGGSHVGEMRSNEPGYDDVNSRIRQGVDKRSKTVLG